MILWAKNTLNWEEVYVWPVVHFIEFDSIELCLVFYFFNIDWYHSSRIVHEIYGLIKRLIIIRCFDSFSHFFLLHNINNINTFTWNKVTHDMRTSDNLKTISMVSGVWCGGILEIFRINWRYHLFRSQWKLDLSLPFNCRMHFCNLRAAIFKICDCVIIIKFTHGSKPQFQYHESNGMLMIRTTDFSNRFGSQKCILIFNNT